MSYPDPNDYVQRPKGLMLLVLVILLMLGLASVACSEEIRITDATPNESVAVQALIDQFDSQDYVVRYDLYSVTPAFVIYAQAAAKLEGAAPMLAAVLASGFVPEGMTFPPNRVIAPESYTEQARLAAAIGLEACGPKAMIAEPTLLGMLESPLRRENIMACGIVRGIGPEAASLLMPLRSLTYAEDFHTQYWACRAIAALGDAGEPAIADLCRLLVGGQEASVRRNACIALGEVAGCSDYLDAAVDLLAWIAANDPCHPVRVEAEAALVKLFGPPKIDPNNPPPISPGFIVPPAEPSC